jgi:hypothetical protein
MITLKVCEGEKRSFLEKSSCLTDCHHSCRMFHLAMQLLAIRGWHEVVILPKIVSSTGRKPALCSSSDKSGEDSGSCLIPLGPSRSLFRAKAVMLAAGLAYDYV